MCGKGPEAPTWLARVHLPGGRGTLVLGHDGRWRAEGDEGREGGPGVVIALWADLDCSSLEHSLEEGDDMARRMAELVMAAWPGAVAEFPVEGAATAEARGWQGPGPGMRRRPPPL